VGRSLETVGVSPHQGGSDPPDQNLTYFRTSLKTLLIFPVT